jgi:hypothetical protein
MSVYVPNYKHDIFVSYAHVDNEPLAGAEKGWVTTLINSLKILLTKKIGRPDNFSLWMDNDLRGNVAITPNIKEQLEGSATILLILSPGYLASKWCRLELSTFLAKAGQNSGCIFLVEHDFVERPEILSDLLGYKFWKYDDFGQKRILGFPKPNPEESEYYQKLDDLANQLLDQIKLLKEKTISINTNDNNTVSIKVFLAEVTYDLEERRTEIKRYLIQQGVQILPEAKYSSLKNQHSLEGDLRQSSLFIQLLSENSGYGYPRFQYQRAKAVNLPILQWREPNIQNISESKHNLFLAESTVIATRLVEFKAIIIQKIRLKYKELEVKKVEKEAEISNQIKKEYLVFINAVPEDMAVAHKIKDILEQHSIGYSLPLEFSEATTPSEIRQDLEQNLLSCDAVMIVYDNTSMIWVHEQLLYCRRMARRRDQPLKLIAVYNTTSTEKPPLNMKLPNMQILACPAPQADSCLPYFLECLSA